MTAGFTGSQNAAFNTINNSQGISAPFTNTAAQYTAQSAQGPTASDISQYQSPYTQQVVDTTQAQLNQNNAVQQQQLQSRAIQSGASPFGGDRAGVAAAALAGQQKMADNSTIANLYNQGFGNAQSEYNTVANAQANAGQAFNNYGTTAQNNALSGAQAQLQAGNQQQELAQQQLNIPYQQYQQALQYPYQQLGVLEQATGLAGGLAGGTSKTTSNSAAGGVAHFASGGVPDVSVGYIPQNAYTVQGSNMAHSSAPKPPELQKAPDPLQQGAQVAQTVKGGKELYGMGKDAAGWAGKQLGMGSNIVHGSDAATTNAALMNTASPEAAGVASSTVPESMVGVAQTVAPAATDAAANAALMSTAVPEASGIAASAAAPAVTAGLGTGAAEAAGAAGLESAALPAAAEAGSGMLAMAGPIGIGAALALPLLSKLFRADGGVAHFASGGSARPTASAYHPLYQHFEDGGAAAPASTGIAIPQLDVGKLSGQDTSAQNYFNPLPQIDRNQPTYAPVAMSNPAAYQGYNSGSSNTDVPAPVYGNSVSNSPTTAAPAPAQSAAQNIPINAPKLTGRNYTGNYAVPQATPLAPWQQNQAVYGKSGGFYDVYDASGNKIASNQTGAYLGLTNGGYNKGGIAHYADGGAGLDDLAQASLDEENNAPVDVPQYTPVASVPDTSSKYYEPLPASPDLNAQKDTPQAITSKNGTKHVKSSNGELIDTGLSADVPSRGIFGMGDEGVAALTAGLTALTGSSKSPLVNLGRGALAGLGEYGASREQAIKDINAQNDQKLKQQQIAMGKYIASRNPITGQMEGVFNSKTGQWEKNPDAGTGTDANEYSKNIGISLKPIQGRADATKAAATMDAAGKSVPQLSDSVASIQRVQELLPQIDQGKMAEYSRSIQKLIGSGASEGDAIAQTIPAGTNERAAYEEIAKLEGNLALNNELSQGIPGSRLGFRMAELGQKIYANPEMPKSAQKSILDKSLLFAQIAKNSNEVLTSFEGSSSGTLSKIKQDYYNQSMKYGAPIPTEDYLAGKYKDPAYKPPNMQPIMGGHQSSQGTAVASGNMTLQQLLAEKARRQGANQ